MCVALEWIGCISVYFKRFFFFNDTATTEIYTLSLHDALPIYHQWCGTRRRPPSPRLRTSSSLPARSEEHTSELQSRQYLVCRLLLEKKKPTQHNPLYIYTLDMIVPYSPISLDTPDTSHSVDLL